MNALLILTAGQTDVQLVADDARQQFNKTNCASLHDEIERRSGEWRLVDSPELKQDKDSESLPQGAFCLCTPKLDAVLRYIEENGNALSAALILQTRRDAQTEKQEPRFAGEILAVRLRERGVTDVQIVSYLTDKEHLEDREQPRDSLIRREVVNRIDKAIAVRLEALNPAQVILATTGGFPVVGNLVEEIVQLRAWGGAKVEPLEVADGALAKPPTKDRAVPRHSTPEPAASYQARRHALELIYRGNLLGAWGAVQHLHADDIERRWTRVVEWLACFAASMPMPQDCDFPVLTHHRMAVRAGLRVELALRAEDIPRAVHGTVAFFESALWDHLGPHLIRHGDPKKRRLYRADPRPSEDLIRKRDGSSDDRGKPFEVAEEVGNVLWYRVYDDDVCAIRLAKHYLQQPSLQKLGQAVSNMRDLRNDVAHNEPTPELMEDARRRMSDAQLWSSDNTPPTFLTQPLVQGVLRELGEQHPDQLCSDLLSTVRSRLLQTCDPLAM